MTVATPRVYDIRGQGMVTVALASMSWSPGYSPPMAPRAKKVTDSSAGVVSEDGVLEIR